MLRQGLGRNRCGSRRPLLALTYRLCPHLDPRFSINMETSLPGQVTTVDQYSPARQIGCGVNGESFRTIYAAFPPRSGFVQPCAQADLRHKAGAVGLASTLGARTPAASSPSAPSMGSAERKIHTTGILRPILHSGQPTGNNLCRPSAFDRH